MANSLDNQVVLESSAAATPAGTPGQGPLVWATLGVTKMAILTGSGVPVNGSPSWAAAGLVPGATRAFYLNEAGINTVTMLYFTVDGGNNWTPASL
jgi:hypothetical protein